jgi:GTP-binding protein HflX
MNTITRCVLVSLDDNVIEISALAESLDYEIVNVFVQNRNQPSSKYFVGQGKVNEIKEYIQENNIDTVIVNSSLKPSQQYNLENILKVTVFDRIRLILNIFADRAHSEEARLQVELAKLQYEVPLLRDWIHKARYSEKPGFMAGGEYEVAQYYEIIRKRMKKIKQKLNIIEKERDLRRKQRRNKGYYQVGIMGYTNAGKSTIFNMISGESVSVEDRLFTTLSTTTRKIPNLKKPIILTDTVGLIDDLPPWIIGAFHSTLEEMFLSDLILLIVDVSEPIDEINRKLKTSFDVLLPDINPSNILLILNKIDKVASEDRVQELIEQIHIEYVLKKIISISAYEEKYREELVNLIQKLFTYPNKMNIIVPNIQKVHSFINWLHENCEILDIEYKNEIDIDLRCKERDISFISNKTRSLDGKITNKTQKES